VPVVPYVNLERRNDDDDLSDLPKILFVCSMVERTKTRERKLILFIYKDIRTRKMLCW